MSQDTVTIIFQETGASNVSSGIRSMGNAAFLSQQQIQTLQQNLLRSSIGLQATAVAGTNAGTALSNMAPAVRTVATESDQLGTSLGSLKAMLVSLGLSLGTKEWITITDNMKEMRAQMAVLGLTTSETESVFKALREVSNRTGTTFESNVQTFRRAAAVSGELKMSFTDIISTIEALQMGLRMSGKNTEDFEQGLRLLFQSMATGHPSMREFMALIRQSDVLTVQLAKTFYPNATNAVALFEQGINKGSIRTREVISVLSQMGGRMSTVKEDVDRVGLGFVRFGQSAGGAMNNSGIAVSKFGATIGPIVEKSTAGLTKLQTDFEKFPNTITRSFVDLLSNLRLFIARADEASGTSQKFANFVKFLADNTDMVSRSITAVLAFLGGYATAAAAAATATFLWNLRLISLATAMRLAFAVVTTIITVFALFGDQIHLTADKTITLAGALRGAYDWLTQTEKGTTVLSVAIGALAAAFGLLALGSVINLFVRMVGVLGTLTTAVGALTAALFTNPWTWVAAGIVTVSGVILYLTGGFDALKEKVLEFTSAVTTELTKAMESATAAGNKTKDSLDKYKTGTDAASDANLRFGDSINKVNAEQTTEQASLEKSKSSMERFKTETDKAAESTNNLNNGIDKGATENKTFSDSLAGLNAQLSQTAEYSEAWYAILDKISAKLRQIGAEQRAAYDAWASRMQQQQQASAGSIGQITPLAAALGDMRNKIAELTAQADLASAMEALGQAASFGNSADLRNQLNLMQARLAIFQTLANTPGTFPEGASPGYGIRDKLDTYGIPYTYGFAGGGSFMVGGAGGTDSQDVHFRASPNERVTIETPEQQRNQGTSVMQPIVIHVHGVTDANSFARTEGQIASRLRNRLSRNT